MLRYTIKINDAAEEDLENAGDYIAFVLLNPDVAMSIVKGIRKQVDSLSLFPESHELDDDPFLANLGVRKIYFKEYKIYYTIDYSKKIVNIVRILHMLADSQARLYRTFGIS